MKVIILAKAQKELDKFNEAVIDKFLRLFDALDIGEELDQNKFKKLSGQNLVEFRVKHNGNIYRGIGRIKNPNCILVTFFQKKTNKTPERLIKVAIKRLNEFLN